MKGIINIFANIQAEPKNHSGLEAWTLSKLFNLSFIGKSKRTNKHINNYIDIDNIDNINDFDVIYLQLSTPNFFGGIIGEDTVDKIKLLYEYNGEFIILCNDPIIKPVNPVTKIRDRDSSLIEVYYEEYWDELLKRATFMFAGKDLNKFYGETNYYNFVYYNWFAEIFKLKLKPELLHVEKEYDVIYYGDRRASYREKQVQKYMPQNDRSLLIGFKQNKIKVPFMKKLKHDELMNTINKSKVSLILADKEHEDNVITFRLYETLASNCLAAIPIEFDPKKEIIKDEVLRSILYVRNRIDVLKLVQRYSDDLILRQHAEFRRLTGQSEIKEQKPQQTSLF